MSGAQDAAPGALDASLELLLPLMEADLFGDIADAKEAAAFAANYRGAAAQPFIAKQRALPHNDVCSPHNDVCIP